MFATLKEIMLSYKIRKRVIQYYNLIDMDKLPAVFRMFSNTIEYKREQRTINNITAFKKFYSEERTILRGNHQLTQIAITPPTVTVVGVFNGELKSGEYVSIHFTDTFTFRDDLITKLITTFTGREV